MKTTTKIKILTVLAVIICLLLSGCGQHKSGSILEDMETASFRDDSSIYYVTDSSALNGLTSDYDESAEIPSPVSKTLLIYMAGTDLESESGIASADILEMAGSGFFTEAMNIVICTGGTSYWWNSEIPNDTCSVFKIIPGGISLCGELNGNNMGDSATLTEFLDFGYKNFPAEEYSLIFWDHGGGSLLGCCFDENFDNDSLSIPEMRSAFDSSQIIKGGHKFEWVGFDACLMAMIEVADAFVPYSKYMVASQENEVGSGWNYGCLKILSSAACKDAKDTVTCISDYYESSCKSTMSTSSYTISGLDLELVDDVKESIDSLSKELSDLLVQGSYSQIARARATARSFGNSGDKSLYDSIDLYDMVQSLSELGIKDTSKLLNEIDEMVFINKTNIDDTNGVSMYFPYVNKSRMDEWLSQYTAFDFSSSYSSFLNEFCKILTGSKISDWDIGAVLPSAETESAKTYNVSVQLSPEDLETYSKGSFSIWENTREDGNFIMWYKSGDVSLSSDGMLSANYDMRQYVLCFGDVELPCSVMLSKKDGDKESFFTPILLYENGNESWVGLPSIYYVYFYFDNEHPDGIITEIKRSVDNDNLIPSRKKPVIESGDLVQTFLFSRQIQVDANGKPLPFENWGNDYIDLYEERIGDVTEMSIKRTTLPATGDYYCVFQVYDTQNISHETDIVELKNIAN